MRGNTIEESMKIRRVLFLGFVLAVLLVFSISAGCVEDDNGISGIWVKDYPSGETFIYEIDDDGLVTETAVFSGVVYKVPHKLIMRDDGTYMIDENQVILNEDGKTLTEVLSSGNTIVYRKNNGYRVPAETMTQLE